ncbi:hypothetical protein NLI96_g1472 [Meripilus lineatus]|uniref:Uncharacterized protein n=1 Tax=Meripilus lineatus TaxID=2056292 RepID=A0AAD5YMS5_9APHY|nr:hypothetical protein NLI96_g1472 [Physisporinus lineatus]
MRTPRSGGPSSPLIDLKASLETYRFTPSPKKPPRKRARDEDDEDVLPTLETVAIVSRRVTRSSTLKAKASFEHSNDVELPTPSKKRAKPNSASGSSKKPKRGFAPPEQYAHLNYLQDILKENLDGMILSYG